MREIKFRAWLTPCEEDSGKMVQVNSILGGLTQPERIFDEEGEKFKDDYGGIILMQYTGLKDKNGKEIYEGDILFANYGKQSGSGEVYTQTGIVKWDYACGCNSITQGWGLFDKEGDHVYSGWGGKHDLFEIIGNIYENPELINTDTIDKK